MRYRPIALLAVGLMTGGGALAWAADCPPDAAICTVPLVDDIEAAPSVVPPVEVEPLPVEPVAPATVAPTVIPPPFVEIVPRHEPAVTGTALVLDWQLKDFWILSGDERPIEKRRVRGSCERGTITASFTVDADGHVRDPKVLRNTSLNPFRERLVEKRLLERFYLPSRANPQRQPVRTEQTFRFDC